MTRTPTEIPDIEGSPDPVSDPKAYQDLLIGLVGDDDPAEVQAVAAGEIRSLVASAGADLRTRPEEGEWSVLECLAHMTDAEMVVSGRYRWILAHDEPELIGYDQDLWVDRLHQPTEDADELLALFEALRQANLALWARRPAAERDRVGLHRERGRESYGLTFTLLAGHDRFHLAQARRALARARSGG
jgi:DinB family protein